MLQRCRPACTHLHPSYCSPRPAPPKRPRIAVCRAAAALDMHGDGYALLLSTLAGLSTSIGGALAVTRKPDEGMLAFLLGSAIGVMATVSAVELWLRNALSNNPFYVTLAVLIGAAAFCILDPLIPKPPEDDEAAAASSKDVEDAQDAAPLLETQREGQLTKATQAGVRSARSNSQAAAAAGAGSGSSVIHMSASQLVRAGSTPRNGSVASNSSISPVGTPLQQSGMVSYDSSNGSGLDQGVNRGMGRGSSKAAAASSKAGSSGSHNHSSSSSSSSSSALAAHHAGLLRLGLVMALTMTLHNLPEGFAVAFSAKASDKTGILMAVAIALHNIPEGVVVAAPIFAATNSRWKALGAATASGLSEPLGAAMALLVFKPFVTSVQRLDYLLAFVGGIMLAVCVVELWPEARRCNHDVRLLQGIALGVVVMAWTLWVGV